MTADELLSRLFLLPWRAAVTVRVCLRWCWGETRVAWLRVRLGQCGGGEQVLVDGAMGAMRRTARHALHSLWRRSNDH